MRLFKRISRNKTFHHKKLEMILDKYLREIFFLHWHRKLEYCTNSRDTFIMTICNSNTVKNFIVIYRGILAFDSNSERLSQEHIKIFWKINDPSKSHKFFFGNWPRKFFCPEYFTDNYRKKSLIKYWTLSKYK